MEKDQDQMPLHLGVVAQNLPITPTLAINELIANKNKAELKEVIHMGFGESGMPLHPFLKEELIKAASFTKYASVAGIYELRQAIAEFLTRTRGVELDGSNIIVGPGCKPLIYTLFHILHGDVLIPTPSWVSYAPIARLSKKKVIPIETDALDHHRLTPEALAKALTLAKKKGANPRILIINSPHNPTGAMFTEEEVKGIANWCKKHGITLISDEIYAELAHGWREHISPVSFYPEGTIIVSGISKTFSAGGWRLGYAAIPATPTGKKVVKALIAMNSEIWSSTATPIQKAAVTAFLPNKSIEKYVKRSGLVFGYVSQQLYEVFSHLGISCPRPAGGFYLYPDFAPLRSVLLKYNVRTSQDLANYLLEEWNIATLPGSAFNEHPLKLRLRLSTSALCEPENTSSLEEREKALWQILDRIEDKKFAPRFPVLANAQVRWSKIILHLKGA